MRIKISFILLLLGFHFQTTAQITITAAQMPKSGDTLRYSTALATDAPDVSKTGTNYVWDFKDLEPNSQDIYAYKASGQTPYILNFGFSAIGVKLADSLGTGQIALQNVYEFFKNSSSGWEAVGLGFSYSSFPLPQAGKHSDPDEIYKFPLTYNNNSNTTFDLKVPIMLSIVPVGNFFRYGTRSTVVDGWGKISTPYAQNVDCIRVKSIIKERDSLAITTPALNFGFPTTRVEYKWLSTTERIPMLEVVGTEVAGNFVANTVRYRDIYREISGPLTPVAAFEANKTNPSPGDTVRFFDKSTGFVQTRNWTITPSTGFTFVNGTNAQSTNPILIFQTPGKYNISLKVENPTGANTMTKSEYIQVKTTGSALSPALDFNIWPNPTHGIIYFGEQPLDYKLFNTSGVCLKSDKYVHRVDLEGFPSGIYLLHISNQYFESNIVKIVKY